MNAIKITAPVAVAITFAPVVVPTNKVARAAFEAEARATVNRALNVATYAGII